MVVVAIVLKHKGKQAEGKSHCVLYICGFQAEDWSLPRDIFVVLEGEEPCTFVPMYEVAIWV